MLTELKNKFNHKHRNIKKNIKKLTAKKRRTHVSYNKIRKIHTKHKRKKKKKHSRKHSKLI